MRQGMCIWIYNKRKYRQKIKIIKRIKIIDHIGYFYLLDFPHFNFSNADYLLYFKLNHNYIYHLLFYAFYVYFFFLNEDLCNNIVSHYL